MVLLNKKCQRRVPLAIESGVGAVAAARERGKTVILFKVGIMRISHRAPSLSLSSNSAQLSIYTCSSPPPFSFLSLSLSPLVTNKGRKKRSTALLAFSRNRSIPQQK